MYVTGPQEGRPCSSVPLLRGKALDLPAGSGCKVCGQPIADGQLVIFSSQQGWIHGACRVLLGGEL